jgi:hypothetical protein
MFLICKFLKSFNSFLEILIELRTIETSINGVYTSYYIILEAIIFSYQESILRMTFIRFLHTFARLKTPFNSEEL